MAAIIWMDIMKNSLKDIHSHILHGIDDGSKSIDDSINILKQAEEDGVTDIILTPHYVYKSTFNCNNISKVNKFKELIEKLKDLDVKLNLYLGNEIYLDENIFAFNVF